MATYTFDSFQIFNDIGDTVVVCLGLDCNTVEVCRVEEVTTVIGFSNFWSTRPLAGLTWNGTQTWVSPPQYGIFHGTPLTPEYTFGIPPLPRPDDREALASWLRSWVASEHGKQHTTRYVAAAEDGCEVKVPQGIESIWSRIEGT
jgi:hypothetical protein